MSESIKAYVVSLELYAKTFQWAGFVAVAKLRRFFVGFLVSTQKIGILP